MTALGPKIADCPHDLRKESIVTRKSLVTFKNENENYENSTVIIH